MKIENRKKTKKYSYGLVAFSLLIAAGIIALVVYLNSDSLRKSPSEDTAKISHVSDTKQSEALKKNPSNKKQATNSDKPSTPTTDVSTGKQRVSMATSYNISDNTIYIRGGI